MLSGALRDHLSSPLRLLSGAARGAVRPGRWPRSWGLLAWPRACLSSAAQGSSAHDQGQRERSRGRRPTGASRVTAERGRGVPPHRPADPMTMAGDAERARFQQLQAGFARAYPRLQADPAAPRTVVVLPSLSLDAERAGTDLGRAPLRGAHAVHAPAPAAAPHRGRVRLTSQPVRRVDRRLLSQPPARRAARAMPGGACSWSAATTARARPLTEKILARPRLLDAHPRAGRRPGERRT